MSTAVVLGASSRATHACGPCKKHKRRCDKFLPACNLCLRTRRQCGYDDTDREMPSPTAAEFAALRARLTELEDRLMRTPENTPSTASLSRTTLGPEFDTVVSDRPTQFPLALFLDIDCYKWAQMRLVRPSVGIPMVRVTSPETRSLC